MFDKQDTAISQISDGLDAKETILSTDLDPSYQFHKHLLYFSYPVISKLLLNYIKIVLKFCKVGQVLKLFHDFRSNRLSFLRSSWKFSLVPV